MFWRRKPSDSNANRLRDEARPNELTFESGRQNELALDDPLGDESEDPLDDEFDDEAAEDDLDDIEEATYEDEPVEEDEEEAARRAAALREEIEREAAEFGLTTVHPSGMYGPNGEQVLRFLERLSDVSDEELEERFDAWAAVPKPERQVALLAVREAEHEADLEGETDSARRAVAAWVVEAVREADDPSGDSEAFYTQMSRAVGDAGVALVLKDELDEADYEVLGGPWAEEVAARQEPEAAATPDAAASGTTPIEEGEFGPNTELVAELLARLEDLPVEQVMALIAAWRKQPQRELRAAHRDLQEVVKEDEEWREQVRRAQDRVRGWINREAETEYAGLPRSRPISIIRPDAAPAVADAISALVLADLLEPQNAELLYEPWLSVVGGPELPLGDDEEDDEDRREE